MLVSVATQTDDDTSIPLASEHLSNANFTVNTQKNHPAIADQWKICHDHTYSMPAPLEYPTYSFDGDSSNVEVPVFPLEEIDDIDDKEVHDDLKKDPEWQPPHDEDLMFNDSNESSEEELDSELKPSETDEKFIVFNSCLDQLLTRCLKCGHVVSSQLIACCPYN